MKTFEEFLHREHYNTECRDGAMIKRRTDRQQTREERNQKRFRTTYIVAVITWALVIAALLTASWFANRSKDVDTLEPVKPAETTTGTIVEETPDEPWDPTHPEEEVIMLAKLIYGEARGCSTTEQAAVVWNVLNRVDHPDFPDNIEDVVLQQNAYDGYSPNHPATDEFMELAEDVLDRWILEKLDNGDHGRVLPDAYVYFHGDGKENWFRTEYEHDGNYYDWSLQSPYEEE